MSFASRLRERRETLGLKQGELGRLLGVTGSAVANYENAVSAPKADILYKVFDALDCDANYLFQDEMTHAPNGCMTAQEIDLVEKFRALDGYGKDTVLAVLDCETLRCKAGLDYVPDDNQP